MPHDVDDGRAPYLQLAEHLRRAIANGEYDLGARLPSVRALAAEHGVANATAARAMTLLKNEGVVAVVTGRGTVVHDLPAMRPPLQEQLDELRRRVDQLEKRRR
ncbi:GntR family transcriptional regulator [Angustibacter sp. McL0619]|uniref:GntR family transcriptional regulator n=1 Tax=Angustibacter sp. McL0619 TaxID=3415676 RepID=UPI003CF220CC